MGSNDNWKHLSGNPALFLLAVLIATALFLPNILEGRVVDNESLRFREWFVTGNYSPLNVDQSWTWISNIEYGSPRLGNPLFYTFYLPAYLGKVISQPTFNYIVYITSITLGLLGAWRFFGVFTQHHSIAILTGTAFVMSGVLLSTALISQYPEKVLFTPWTLYFLARGIVEKRALPVFVASLLHALHFVASPAFLWFYLSSTIALFIAGYALWTGLARPFDRNVLMQAILRGLKTGSIFFIPSGLLIAVFVLPIREYGDLAIHRTLSEEVYMRTGRLAFRGLFKAPFWFPGAMGPTRQMTEFVNMSYLGWVPMFLAFLWLRTSRLVSVSAIMVLLFVTVLAAASKDPVISLLRSLPAMNLVRSTAYWMLVWNLTILGLAVYAGNRLGKEISWQFARTQSLILLGLALVGLAGLVFLWKAPYSMELLRPIVMGVMVLLICSWGTRQTRGALIALAVVAVIDSASWPRSLLVDKGPIQPNIELKNRMSIPADGQTIQIGGPGQGRALAFQTANGQGDRMFTNFPRMEWANTFTSFPLRRSFGIAKRFGWSEVNSSTRHSLKISVNQILTVPGNLDLARLLNIRFYFVDSAANRALLEKQGFREVVFDPYSGFHLSEDPLASPRALFFSGARTLPDIDAAMMELERLDKPLLKAIIEPGSSLSEAQKTALSGTAPARIDAEVYKVTRYSHTQVTINGSAAEPGILVLSDMIYPGWRATIDGRETEIFPANFVGRGIFLPPGEHEVRFFYKPASLRNGLIVSLIAFLGLAVAVVIWNLRRYKAHPQPGN